MGKPMRLDKFLVEMNKGSRSQIKEAAKKGRIQVNGQVEKKTERKIDPATERVLFDGLPVTYQEFEYYMLNKPQGVVSATQDNLHRTVIDLLPAEKRGDLFPVGRLDIDTEGLLLITNDGDLAHRLLAPEKHVDKQYYARVDGVLPEDSIARMAAGLTLSENKESEGTKLKPAKLEVLKKHLANCNEILLTIQEGKFHQVKRMFEALGCHVTYLKRLSMGPLQLDSALAAGEYRKLTEDEIQRLKEHTLKEIKEEYGEVLT